MSTILRTVPKPLRWTYEVNPAPPNVWRDAFPDETCAALIQHWHSEIEAGRCLNPAFDGGDPPPAEIVVPPLEANGAIVGLLSAVADHFDLPFTPSTAQSVLARYSAGQGTEWHLDGAEIHAKTRKPEPGSINRTVSFSALLNDDFDGGDLETDPGGAVLMTSGDVCGFTSRTWHRANLVTAGERFVLIGFGGFKADPVLR